MKTRTLIRLALSVILIASITGCYDKEELVESDNYQFKEIVYTFEEEGDGFSTYEVECPPVVTDNDSPTLMTYTNRPFDNVWQETTFRSDDPEAFTWMGDGEQYVNTPYMFLDELYSGGTSTKYCSGTVKAPSPNSTSGSFPMAPYTRITTINTLQYSKMVATYTLIFVGEYTKTEKYIKGKFIRITPESCMSKYKVEDITE